MYTEGRWLVCLDIVEVDYKRDYVVAVSDLWGNTFVARQRFAKVVAAGAFIEATRKAIRAGATPVGNAKWTLTAGPMAKRAQQAAEERLAAASVAYENDGCALEGFGTMRPEAAE